MTRRKDNTNEMHLMDDAQLAAMGKAGCSEAMGELYKRHRESMVDLCLRITHDREEALDVVHDGFIIVCSNIGSLHDDRRIGGWMARIMSNLALRQVAARRRNRQAENEAHWLQYTGEDSEYVPIEVLMDMIDRLPHGYGQVFRLSVLDGLGHDEIARLAGIKPKSSASQLARARMALRHMIDEWRRTSLVIASITVVITTGILLHTAYKKRLTSYTDIHGANTDVKTHSGGVPPQARAGHSIEVIAATTTGTATTACADTAVMMTLEGMKPASIATTCEHLTTMAKLHQINICTATTPPTPSGGRRISLSLGGSTASAASLLLANVIHTAARIGSGASTRGGITTWEELNHYITYTPPEGMNPVERDALTRISMMNQGRIMTRRQFCKPLAFDLTTSLQLSDRWAVEGGLRLTRTGFEAVTGNSDTTNITRTDKTLYIGIPININYTMARKGKWRLYATAGIAVDVPVWHSTAIDYNIDNRRVFRRNTPPDRPAMQWSAGAGIGVGYEAAPHIELFFAPQATYHLPAGGTPTLWQEQRLKLSWPVGIRLKY